MPALGPTLSWVSASKSQLTAGGSRASLGGMGGMGGGLTLLELLDAALLGICKAAPASLCTEVASAMRWSTSVVWERPGVAKLGVLGTST